MSVINDEPARDVDPIGGFPLSTMDEVLGAVAQLVDGEDEVEDDRGQVDWDATFERLERWYGLALPVDSEDPRYKAIRREVRRARRDALR